MLEIFSKRKGQKGFTLIELLVVIAIIGILATIVLVSLNTAREKARDARRQSDIRQIGLAMEMCYDDSGCGAGASAYVSQAAAPAAIGSYMTLVPTDPHTAVAYHWVDNSTDSSTYLICADLENGDITFSYPGGTRTETPTADCATDYALLTDIP